MKLERICIPFVLVLTIVSTNLIDLQNESNTEVASDMFLKSAINCMTVITNKCIPCGTLITFIYTMTGAPHIHALNKLLSEKNCYNFIVRSFQTEDWLIWTDVYIISLNKFSELYTSFKNLSRDITWNPAARFIILIYQFKRPKSDVFSILMPFNIFNVVLITESEKDEIKVNTYNPINNNSCGQSYEVINVMNCEEVDLTRTNYKYLEQQFRNCTINIAGFEDVPNFIYATNKEYSFIQNNIEGLEQYLLSNIAKQENLTLKYINADAGVGRGVILSNWTVTGLLGYLENNTVDIVTGGFLLLRNRMLLFDSILGYNYAAFYVFIPALGEVTWSKVHQPFSVTTWTLIALSYCLVTFTLIFSGKYIGKFIGLPLKLWGYFFGNTNPKLIHLKKLRIIVIGWIWFTFFITNFYNTAFYSLLTAKSIEKVTFLNKSLDSLPFKPCISASTRVFFKYKYNQTFPGEPNDNCKNTDDALDTVANSREFYALEKGHAYNIREFKYIDDEGNRQLDSFRYTEFLKFALYTRRGFPLQKKFRRYASYHIEAGLLTYHARTIYHRYNIHNKPFSVKFKTFSLTDFRIHFGVLFLGYFISLMCFIIEINAKLK